MKEQMIAIVKGSQVTGFIMEDAQKAFLLKQDPNLKFYPFEWDVEEDGAPNLDWFVVTKNKVEYIEK